MRKHTVALSRHFILMQAFVKRDEYRRSVVKITSELLVQIGAQLKEARERKFYTVKDISKKTCVPAHHILAIELGDRKKLPEDIFLISFIKKYAKVVGLNENTVFVLTEQDAFDLLFQEKTSDNVIHFKRRQAGLIKVCHVYYLIGFLLFVFASYLLFSNAEKKLVFKQDDSIYKPNIDFNKVESWVGGEESPVVIHKPQVKKQLVVKQAVKQEIKHPKIEQAQVAKNQPVIREIKLRPLR